MSQTASPSVSEPDPDPVTPARGGRTVAVVGTIISVLAIAGVLWWALQQEAPALPSTSREIFALVAAVALYFGACGVRAERWLLLVRHNGGHPLRRDMYALTAVGYMGNNVLPARAGDALRVVFLHPRVDTDRRTIIGTLLAERVLDVVVLATLFAVLAFGALQGIEVPEGGRVALGLAVVSGLAAGAAAVWWLLQRTGRAAQLRTFVTPMLAALTRLRGRHLVEALALSVTIWTIELVVWWVTGIAS